MRLDEHAPLPSRDWDELLAHSVRRGKQLRRRRRALLAAPVVALVAVAVAVPLSGGIGNGHNGIDRLQISHETPTPEPLVSHSFAPGPSVIPTSPIGSAGAGTPASAGSTTNNGAAPASTVLLPTPSVTVDPLTPVAALHFIPQSLTWTDTTGSEDRDEEIALGAAVPVDPEPSYDITKMRLETTRAGLRVTMWLVGKPGDGPYWLGMTDTRNDCVFSIMLGGQNPDYTDVQCPSSPSVAATPDIPDTRDGAHFVVAVVPWRLFPSAVSTHDTFETLNGKAEGPYPHFDMAYERDRTAGPFR